MFEENNPKSSKSKSQKKTKLTPERLREIEAEREREAQGSWRRVKNLWPTIFGVPYPSAEGDEGDGDIRMRVEGEEDGKETEEEREWFLEAEKLIESYRETRALFTSSRVSKTHLILSTMLIFCELGRIRYLRVCSLLGRRRITRPWRIRRRTRIGLRRGCILRWVRLSLPPLGVGWNADRKW